MPFNYMLQTKILTAVTRSSFDPTNVDHLKEFKYFVENRRWRNKCIFILEYPWQDIPTMCYEKYAKETLKAIK